MRELLHLGSGDVDAVRAAVLGALDGDGPAVLPLADDGPEPGPLPAEVHRRTALVVRSSGSTGAPKYVGLSAVAALTSARATNEALGGAADWLLALPLHYIAGLQVLVRAAVAERELHALEEGPFSAGAFANAVRRVPADRRLLTALVPAQVARVVEAADEGDATVLQAIRRIDAVLVGGQRTPQDVVDRAERHGLRLVRTYGASETAGGCVYDGRPVGDTQVRVVDGEVQLSGPSLAEGYVGDKERTRAAFVKDGGRRWYRTGDTGEWDGARLEVTGRLDDVIVSGGEKVSLGLVERVVREQEGFRDAVVVPARDEEWGTVPVVVTADGGELKPLRRVVKAKLGRAAAPARIIRVETMPMLPSGKPDRVAARRAADS